MSPEMTEKHWYVLRAVFRKEIAVRDALRRAGFHCYVPMTYRLHIEKGHKVRRLVPAVSQLVFVYGSVTAITDYKLRSKDTIYWLTVPKANRRDKMIVPDKAMEDFIRITQQNEQSVTYFRPDELKLSKDDHILIHGGPFDGVEGVLLKVKGKREKQLLVILLTVLLEENKEYVLLMDEPESSLHVEWQQRLVDIIRQLNPNAQLILTTHSPAVIMNGWLDAVTDVKDITVNE